MQIFISLLLMITPMWVLKELILPMKELRTYNIRNFKYVLMSLALIMIMALGFVAFMSTMHDPNYVFFNVGL